MEYVPSSSLRSEDGRAPRAASPLKAAVTAYVDARRANGGEYLDAKSRAIFAGQARLIAGLVDAADLLALASAFGRTMKNPAFFTEFVRLQLAARENQAAARLKVREHEESRGGLRRIGEALRRAGIAS